MAQHYPNLWKECKPICQKLRQFHPTRKEVIKHEVDKILAVGFIREIQYPKWLSNVVVVPKKNEKWRMCVDYSNLNDDWPKDTFPLLYINQTVNSTSSHQLLSFLNAYSGYNQIPMHPPDMPIGMYCYNVMPFGLKNVGATSQRMMSRIFEPLLGRTMKSYIDDMLVKSKSWEDLSLTFEMCFN